MNVKKPKDIYVWIWFWWITEQVLFLTVEVKSGKYWSIFHLSPDIWEERVRKSNRTDWLWLSQRSKTGTQCPDLSYAQPKLVWDAPIHGAPANTAASEVGSFTPSSPRALLSLVPPLPTFPSPRELPSPLISRFLSYSASVGQPLLSLRPPKNCLA